MFKEEKDALKAVNYIICSCLAHFVFLYVVEHISVWAGEIAFTIHTQLHLNN